MKVFKSNENSYNESVNFVDDNDVFVGYESFQKCCEKTDWFIGHTIHMEHIEAIPDKDMQNSTDMAEFQFDTSFFLEIECSQLKSGKMVVFRLTDRRNIERFLHIFNVHEGYVHGLTVKHYGSVVKSVEL